MDIAIGPPNALDIAGPDVVAWAPRARERAWQDAGRDGEPRIGALVYFGLDDADVSMGSPRRYHPFLPDGGEGVARPALRPPDTIRAAVRAFADAGVTELVLDPPVPPVDDVDRLADVVL